MQLDGVDAGAEVGAFAAGGGEEVGDRGADVADRVGDLDAAGPEFVPGFDLERDAGFVGGALDNEVDDLGRVQRTQVFVNADTLPLRR